MAFALTDDEMGKRVVDAAGTRLGTVETVRDGVAHVSADDATVAKMQRALETGGTGENRYALDGDSIAEITDEEVVLDAEY
ncbi:PRC-barrel domain containing protein [Halorussus halophilus]|uniref:PRC-barrel domain containing protein n=1 Tax=Halorussus halophilus TaxID=2650975 RepID=UPI0013016028|nr:PRC-barrel domain containing protein [Halorussus halophilus]